MTKYKVGGDGGANLLNALNQAQSTVKGKVPTKTPPKTQAIKSTQVHGQIDATEVSENQAPPSLGAIMKKGRESLAQQFYGTPGGEPSFLSLLGGTTEVGASVPDHVVTAQAKRYAKELGISPEQAKALVLDLAVAMT